MRIFSKGFFASRGAVTAYIMMLSVGAFFTTWIIVNQFEVPKSKARIFEQKWFDGMGKEIEPIQKIIIPVHWYEAKPGVYKVDVQGMLQEFYYLLDKAEREINENKRPSKNRRR